MQLIKIEIDYEKETSQAEPAKANADYFPCHHIAIGGGY